MRIKRYTSKPLTIKELIEELEEILEKTLKDSFYVPQVFFDFGRFPPAIKEEQGLSSFSYRGNYSCFSLGWSSRTLPVKTDEFVAFLKEQLGKTKPNWKGGRMRVEESTLIYAAEDGIATGTLLVGCYYNGVNVILLTRYCIDVDDLF